jgi:hypothetical protein
MNSNREQIIAIPDRISKTKRYATHFRDSWKKLSSASFSASLLSIIPKNVYSCHDCCKKCSNPNWGTAEIAGTTVYMFLVAWFLSMMKEASLVSSSKACIVRFHPRSSGMC